ncbi:MAG: hypothetical protein H5T59_08415, partial [Anaerolineae bacterium]|nr:hypothetical protein [Anaerolineae bacterium]
MAVAQRMLDLETARAVRALALAWDHAHASSQEGNPMCGIVGYVGKKDAVPLVLEGLKRLEYRGYDSAGLAVIQDGEVAIRRCVGKLQGLVAAVEKHPLRGQVGVGHTRWATHGEPCER